MQFQTSLKSMSKWQLPSPHQMEGGEMALQKLSWQICKIFASDTLDIQAHWGYYLPIINKKKHKQDDKAKIEEYETCTKVITGVKVIIQQKVKFMWIKDLEDEEMVLSMCPSKTCWHSFGDILEPSDHMIRKQCSKNRTIHGQSCHKASSHVFQQSDLCSQETCQDRHEV